MPQSIRFAICAIAVCNVVDFASAQGSQGGPSSIYPANALTCPHSLLRACCDIYCPKPMPCIKAFCRGCRKDDYCSKPAPTIPCYCRTGTSYCYCPKPCPDLCRPIAADYFACAQWHSRCADADTLGSNMQTAASTSQFEDGTNESNDIQLPPVPDYSN
jgi:hypothetical protein